MKSKQENKLDVTKKIEEQQKIIDDYTNMLKRLQAEFENYIKRIEKEKQEFTDYSNHKLISKLLNIVDDFEKALGVIKNSDEEIASGLEMIYKQMQKILDEEGVQAISSIGNKFDPYKHEVVDIKDGGEEDIIVEELQRGYILKDKVLRPSKVRISKVMETKNDRL